MICYSDSNEPVCCPYCSSVDTCEHLFASYDSTFDTLEGGFLQYNDSIEPLIQKFFLSAINKYGLDTNLKFKASSEFENIWSEIIYNKKEYSKDDAFFEDAFFLPSICRYVFEKLDEIESPEFGEFEGGPGMSSTYNLYYTKNTIKTHSKLIEIIEEDFRLNSHVVDFT